MKAAVNCSHRTCRQGALGVLLLFSLALVGCAHSPEPIGPEGIIGERARVQLDARRSYEGILRDLDDDVATLETEGEALRPIRLSSTARLEIVRGTKSNAGRGAGLGALFGGAGFAIVGLARCEDSWVFSRDGCILGSTFAGVGTGALVGLIVGAMSESERWVEVDRTRPPRGP